MKRILAIVFTVLIFSATVATAEEITSYNYEEAKLSVAPKHPVKKFFRKTWKKIKPDEAKPSVTSEEVMTPHKQAVIFYNDGNPVQAMDTILAMSENERSAEDWFLLGNLLQDKDRISDAIFMYKRAIAIDEDYYKPYYNLGNIYLEEEKPFLALENYKKAVKLNNEFAYTYYNMGCAYLKMGELKKAKTRFLKAIELKNTVADFHYNMAYTYKGLNKPKLAQQYLNNYNKLIENNEDNK